jgi:hypothetical protein
LASTAAINTHRSGNPSQLGKHGRSWRQNGDRPISAAVILMAFARGEGGAFGETIKLRGTVEVAVDGQGLTASYTTEVVGQDEVGLGQGGPMPAAGQRIAVESMGTPVSGPIP